MTASRNRRNGKAWAITALGGIGAALAVLSTPVGLLEMIVASLGLSEILPAAAPPLGLKARGLMALFAALMSAAIIAVTRREGNGRIISDTQERGRQTTAPGVKKMGFALSKLTALARGRTADVPERTASNDGMVPSLRRADAHPDAPARAPIFARRDFGGLDIFARTEPGRRELVVNAEPEREPVVPATGLDMPSAPAPLPETALPTPAPTPMTIRPAFTAPMAEQPAMAPVPAASVRPVETAPAPVAAPDPSLSVSELTARLERGLAQRSRPSDPTPATPRAPVLATMPRAQAVPVAPAVADDVDAALRAALGTLRTMTARAR